MKAILALMFAGSMTIFCIGAWTCAVDYTDVAWQITEIGFAAVCTVFILALCLLSRAEA